MSTQVQLRGDTAADIKLSVPVEREVVVNTTDKRLHVGDGVKSGGIVVPNAKDVQNSAFTYANATGSDDILIELQNAPESYVEGQTLTFKPQSNNTGSAKLNVNDLGERAVKKDDGAGVLVALEPDDIKANIPITVIYSGTEFVLQLSGGTSGTYVLLDEVNASSISSIDYTDSVIDGSYTRYEFHITRLLPSNNGDVLYMRASVDGGATYVTVGQYVYYGEQQQQGVSPSPVIAVDTALKITENGVSSAGNGVNGEIVAFDPSNAIGAKFLSSHVNYVVSNGNAQMADMNHALNGNPFLINDVNGFQLYFGSGDIASGKVKVYGVI